MRTIIHLSLASLLTFQPAIAAETSATTSAMQGVAGALGHVNSLFGSIQSSQMGMQGLVNQLAGQMGNMPVTQFDQVRMQLAAAMGEAQTCLLKAKKDYSKYKKAPKTSQALNDAIAAVPTCSNYGAIIDSARMQSDLMRDANTKMTCITNMQNKINEIAEGAKAPFNQMTKAAEEVWNTRKSIIETHEKLAEQVDKELNGEGGYKEQLRKLENLDRKISNALKAGGGEKDGKGGMSLNQRLENLKYQSVDLANTWYKSVMREVHACFVNDTSRVCPFTGSTGSPAACIQAYAANTGKGSASDRAQAKANSSRVSQLFTVTGGTINLLDGKTNIDLGDTAQLGAFADSRFKQMVDKVVANFRSQQFVGTNVNSGALASFVREQYESCYQASSAKDMTSTTGQYQSMLSAFKAETAGLNEEIANWVKDATSAMTEFRTQFNKNYDRSLQQYTNDCLASESPVKSAACLRQVSTLLHNDIYGTVSSTSNSGSVPYAASTTVVNLQTMTLDQTGKPTVTTTPTHCVGFKECLGVLDKYQAHNKTQAEAQTKSRDEFVVTHNKNMDTALTAVSAQFAQIGKMITADVNALKLELGQYGVDASALKTTPIEGEPLAKNETTGLYDMPKSMKAAMAGVGSYSELDDPSAITDSYNKRIEILNEKLKDAAKAKAACAIRQGDLDAILNRIGSCDANICNGDRVTRMLGPLESLVRKSQMTPGEESEKDTITRDFDRCSRNARNDTRAKEDSYANRQAQIEAMPDLTEQLGPDGKTTIKVANKAKLNAQNKLIKEQARKAQYSAEDSQSCSQNAVGDLEALAANGRESMRATNDKIMAAIRGISDACSAEPLDEIAVEAAIEACENAKKAVKSASLPSDEAETDVTASSSSDSEFSNPYSGGVKGAQ